MHSTCKPVPFYNLLTKRKVYIGWSTVSTNSFVYNPGTIIQTQQSCLWTISVFAVWLHLSCNWLTSIKRQQLLPWVNDYSESNDHMLSVSLHFWFWESSRQSVIGFWNGGGHCETSLYPLPVARVVMWTVTRWEFPRKWPELLYEVCDLYEGKGTATPLTRLSRTRRTNSQSLMDFLYTKVSLDKSWENPDNDIALQLHSVTGQGTRWNVENGSSLPVFNTPYGDTDLWMKSHNLIRDFLTFLCHFSPNSEEIWLAA